MEAAGPGADGQPFEAVAARQGRLHLRSADRRVDLYLDADAPTSTPVVLRPVPGAPGWEVSDAHASFRVGPESVRRHESLPGFFAAPLARFAPSPRERRVVRWLMRLLRVPGVTRLIRAWHAARTR